MDDLHWVLQVMIAFFVFGLAWFIASARPYFEMIERNRAGCAEDRSGDDDCMGDESWRAER